MLSTITIDFDNSIEIFVLMLEMSILRVFVLESYYLKFVILFYSMIQTLLDMKFLIKNHYIIQIVDCHYKICVLSVYYRMIKIIDFCERKLLTFRIVGKLFFLYMAVYSMNEINSHQELLKPIIVLVKKKNFSFFS